MAAIKIDKSLFTPDELAQYEALLAKATVNPDENEDEMEDEMPPEVPAAPAKAAEEAPEGEDETEKKCPTKKSADPLIQKALDDLKDLKKSMELKELAEVAKKYAPLGKPETELAKTLYDMRSASPANYGAYLQVLDQSLALVEKSGVFAEIGKTGRGQTSGSVEERIAKAATDIQKTAPDLSREQAMVKAWDANPDLVAEYEREYRQ